MQISLDSTSIYYSNIQVHYSDDKNFQILYFRNIGAGIQLRLDSKKYILLSKQQKLLIFSFWNQMVNSVSRKDHAQQYIFLKFRHHIHTLSLKYFKVTQLFLSI